MVSEEQDRRLLQLAEVDSACSRALIVILQKVALARVLILGLKEDRVLRRQLHLELAVGLGAVYGVIRPITLVILILRVERVANVAEDTELRGSLSYGAMRKVACSRAKSKPVCLEHLRVFLLGNELRKGTTSYRR